MSIDFTKLAEPFDESQLEWRVGRCGISNNNPWVMALCYVTSRAVQDRLDDVVGTENWQDDYEDLLEDGKVKGYRCQISIRTDNGWVYKTDAAPQTQIEDIKGGHSDAFKRAAVKWGIGRYLYGLDEGFCHKVSFNKQRGWKRAKEAKTGKMLYWLPPELPEWARAA